MTQRYNAGRPTGTWRKLALLGLLSLATGAAYAQKLDYNVAGAANVAGTYTDLGTTGTVIATANTDDANSAATPIGFSFSFNKQNFTDFVLNTNGAIRLGTAAPSAADFFITQDLSSTATDPLLSTDPADTNILMPFNVDLVAGTAANGAEYRMATTGTAPNRVCTIQWKNVSDKAGTGTDKSATQYASFSFQLKLYETSNQIEFVYDNAVASTGTAFARFPNVGLKGSGLANDQTVLAIKSLSSAPWSTTSFITGNYTTFTHNFRADVGPDAGRTYRFSQTVLPANDVAVTSVFTLGQLTQSFNSPHAVQAVITNNSAGTLTNIPVTLKVSGHNTFTNVQTIASLESEKSVTVTFAAYPLTSTGTNTVTVTVPDDNVNTNNSASATQNVSTNRLAYTDPNAPFNATGVGVSADGILAAKFTVTQPTTVYAVKPTFTARTDNTATYQIVLLDATGANGTPNTVLYTSPTQTRTAAGGTVTIAIPGIAVSGDFFVGIKQLSATNIGLANQVEDPLRPDTYYFKRATGNWNSLNTVPLQTRLALEANVGTPAACDVPADLTVTSASANSATVTFTGAAAATGYTIIYGPSGFDPATGGTTVTTAASPYTINGLTASTNYQVYIRTTCSATSQSDLVGPVQVTTACQPPIITSFPYTENFDGVTTAGTLPCGVVVANVNNDNRTWQVGPSFPNGPNQVSVANSGPNAIFYRFSTPNAADDWFFTPALFLRAGSTYQLNFKYRAFDPLYSEKLEVKFGSTNTPADQTTTIWNNDNIQGSAAYVATGEGTVPAVTAITPTTTGNYYIGFHAYSQADQYVLAIDDITVTTNTVTATSAALQQAISLYPNPTAGQLTLRVAGANAKNGLLVEISNMLGQRVRTTTVPDNATSQLDLADLANGLYSVKVRHGNEVMVQRIAVQR